MEDPPTLLILCLEKVPYIIFSSLYVYIIREVKCIFLHINYQGGEWTQRFLYNYLYGRQVWCLVDRKVDQGLTYLLEIP